VERDQWQFLQAVRRGEEEAEGAAVAPSRIPVGAFRVEEERAINRALSRPSSPRGRSPSPAPASRIPKFSGPPVYRRVQDTLEAGAAERRARDRRSCGGRLQPTAVARCGTSL
jgi:hypothetical protein